MATTDPLGTVFTSPESGQAVGTSYRAPGEDVTCSRWQLSGEFERMRKRRKPHGEWALIPLAMFLGLLPNTVTRVTFSDGFGLTADQWKVALFFSTVITLVLTLVLAFAWAVLKIARPDKSGEEMVEDMLDRIDAAEQRVAKREAARRQRQAAAAAPQPSTGQPAATSGVSDQNTGSTPSS
jgi:hypothetical protein